MQAYAAARMAESVLRGMAGEGDIYECAYVQSQVTEVRTPSATLTDSLACCVCASSACVAVRLPGVHALAWCISRVLDWSDGAGGTRRADCNRHLQQPHPVSLARVHAAHNETRQQLPPNSWCCNTTQVPFFASKCRLGPNGVEEIHGLGKMSSVEEQAVKDLIPILRKNIDTGVEFANKN